MIVLRVLKANHLSVSGLFFNFHFSLCFQSALLSVLDSINFRYKLDNAIKRDGESVQRSSVKGTLALTLSNFLIKRVSTVKVRSIIILCGIFWPLFWS